MAGARYDGIADWYDMQFQPAPLESETWQTLGRLLDDSPGRCSTSGAEPAAMRPGSPSTAGT